VQLGHSGRKGSTRLMWEGMDQPLPEETGKFVARRPSRTRPPVRLRAS
jgi:anthraniloyl-CoA monooxygenase